MEKSNRAPLLDEALRWSPVGLQQTLPRPDLLQREAGHRWTQRHQGDLQGDEGQARGRRGRGERC